MLTSEADPRPGKVVIIGDGNTAELAFDYFTRDSPHDVVGFAVEAEWRTRDQLLGLPVVDLEQIDAKWPPDTYLAHVALSWRWLNRARRRLFQEMKWRGYTLASYVSSHAFVWHDATIGENSTVAPGSMVSAHAVVGDNVTLWPQSFVGQRTTIGAHVVFSVGAKVAGLCDIGESCFLGMDSSVGDEVTIGPDTLIGMGCVVHRGLEGGRVYVGNPAHALDRSSYDTMDVPDELR